MLVWIAVANAVVWTVLFLFVLLARMRGEKEIDARLEQLESRHNSDEGK